ncbi:unnamed protein product [Ostreobium quekettii]|uniref:Protein SEC13 homolog n=1 Tax=Ostreobium quekettii TaxID=121088 RepID=A0A8S1IRB7_9CHLO|nr:unnamed protein product [Ostreobium quekettii]
MTHTLQSFETGHTDMVHDIQLDYSGRRLATCSSDRTIKIFDVSGDQQMLVGDLQGHSGPVWQVAWAHAKYGSVLASCSFDNTVIVWQELEDGRWTKVYQTPPSLHTASVNSICWAPYELGLILACASSDGTVSVMEGHPDGTWDTRKIYAYINDVWALEHKLIEHSDWVLDVAWAPNMGLPKNTIASAGQDGKVLVWKERDKAGWDKVLVKDFQAPVWRLSWSITGNILAVSDASNNVSLWKESPTGKWQQVTQ